MASEAKMSTTAAGHDEPTRRDFITTAALGWAAVGGAIALWPFIQPMNPDASTQALSSTEVDLAAIDCVSFGLILRAAPEFGESIAVIARTPTSPALPFIAAAGLPREAHAAAREALADVLADPTLARVRADLGLIGMSVLPPQAYRRIDELESLAVGLGYPELA